MADDDDSRSAFRNFFEKFHYCLCCRRVERGADVFDYRGAERIAAAGDIMLINPAEVHTGHAIDENGWSFRIMYVDPKLLKQVREEITGKSSDIPFFSKTVVRDDATAQQILRLHHALENSTSHLERESLFLQAMTQLVSRHADSKINSRKTGRKHASVAAPLIIFTSVPAKISRLKN